MITLEPITPEVALIFKAVRLRALQESPTAFSSTYAKESQLPDDEWLKRSVRWASDGSIGYIAFDEGNACGLVACYAEEKHPARAHVISMWVDPACRRAGVGKMLIDALITWATAHGLHELKLMVVSVNQGAIEFYEHIGFRRSGVTGPYPNDPAIMEYEMLLTLHL
jgi:ribosomal protein S18 acetylase RimI-like enzyme